MSAARIANRYQVEEELASGGMGVVYRVRDRSSGEEVALKRLSPELVGRAEIVEAFEREYLVLAGLEHPRIIRVFDYGVDTLGPYYTMELLKGQDLRRAAPLPFKEACRYLRDVATSLALLHARRWLHRDLSAGNVRTTGDGRCKLIDFGALVPFGTAHLVIGTPTVISPEALAGAPLDQRSDLYALGALAYWTLTGRHAFPARRFDELPQLWKRTPAPPSTLVPSLPEGLDELVLALLNTDARGRPGSAAEVISRLNLLADLTPEDGETGAKLAESFFLGPRFVGRDAVLERTRGHVDALLQGRGGVVRIEAAAGMGSSRLLEEIGLRAQIAGACVVRADVGTVREWNGAARALVLGVFDALPQLARENAGAHRGALCALGPDVERKFSPGGSLPPGDGGTPSAHPSTGPSIRPFSERPSAGGGANKGSIDGFITDVSLGTPLVLEIDNVDDADDPSLGVLAALATAAAPNLLLVVTETKRAESRSSPGLVALRTHGDHVVLEGLSSAEMLELCRSFFGDAPNVERFAEWLHDHTAGSPLYAIEISRRLVETRFLRYLDGMWVLPEERPRLELPVDLEGALTERLAALGASARRVAECLALTHERATLPLVRLLVQDPEQADDRLVLQVLDELSRNDVLVADRGGYRFVGTALRDALLANLDRSDRKEIHRRLGSALAQLAGPGDLALRVHAGWHLIQGGDDGGADLVARVTHHSDNVQRLISDLHHIGEPVEAALQVYRRRRRSLYERAPLLAALAHASFTEDRIWGERYGDEALDTAEDLAGVRTARYLRRFLGRWLALMIGIVLAMVRYHLTPRREREYPFDEIPVRLFGTVVTLGAAASVALDVDRATRIAAVIEIFSALPERFAPVSIYRFCCALAAIGQERQASTYRTIQAILPRFDDPRDLIGLPPNMRLLVQTGAHFARGVFATFRADSRLALESADFLEASGIRMFAMIACRLRVLYHTYRGELADAAVHRERAEVHAAHLGTAWQVDLWEPAALIPVAARLRDVVTLARIADGLEQSSQSVPSLDIYRRLSAFTLLRARGGASRPIQEGASAVIESQEPRSFIGWAHSIAIVARTDNEAGFHDRARAHCEKALALVTDEDRDFVALFLDLDIEMANALAGLGESDVAIERLDALILRFEGCDHPLMQGTLHEARARIAWNAGRVVEYRESLAVAERWFRPTGTAALVASVERLARLEATVGEARMDPGGDTPLTSEATMVVTATLAMGEGGDEIS